VLTGKLQRIVMLRNVGEFLMMIGHSDTPNSFDGASRSEKVCNVGLPKTRCRPGLLCCRVFWACYLYRCFCFHFSKHACPQASIEMDAENKETVHVHLRTTGMLPAPLVPRISFGSAGP